MSDFYVGNVFFQCLLWTKLGLQWVSELIRNEWVEKTEPLCLLADEIFTMVLHKVLSEGFFYLRVSKVILVLLLSHKRGGKSITLCLCSHQKLSACDYV